MKVPVLDLSGKSSREIELNPAVFSVAVRDDIMARVVLWQQARARSGNHATKNISQIKATTKKPFRQKGTGNARQGSKVAAHHRGGAVAHGPVVRSHAYGLPKKVRRLGLKSALSRKLADGSIKVVDFSEYSAISTSKLAAFLSAIGSDRALIVDVSSENYVLPRSTANIPHVDFLYQEGLNVLSLLSHDKLILTPDAVDSLHARLAQ